MDSGLVYDLLESTSDLIKGSGSFNVTDGNTSASGTFSDVLLNCSERGG